MANNGSTGDTDDEHYGSSDFEQDSRSGLFDEEYSLEENATESTKRSTETDNKLCNGSNDQTKKEKTSFGHMGDDKEPPVLKISQRRADSITHGQRKSEASRLFKRRSTNTKTSIPIPTKSDHTVVKDQSYTALKRKPVAEDENLDDSPPNFSQKSRCHSESLESRSPCNLTVESSESFSSSWSYDMKEKKPRKKDLTPIMDEAKSWSDLDNNDKKFIDDPFPLLADLRRTIKEIQAEIPENDDDGSQDRFNVVPLHIEGVIVEARDLPHNRMIGGNTFVRVLYVSPGKGHITSRSKRIVHQTNLAVSSPHPSWNSYFSSIFSGKVKGDMLFALYTVINNENYFIGQAQVKTSLVRNKMITNRRNICNWFPLSSWNGERLEAGAAVLLKLDIYPRSTSTPLPGLPVPPPLRNHGDSSLSAMMRSRKSHLPLNDVAATVRERHRLHKIRQRQLVKKRIDEENDQLWKRIARVKSGKGRPVSTPYIACSSPASSSTLCNQANSSFGTNELNTSATASEFNHDKLSEKVKDASTLLAAISEEVAQLLKQF